MEIFQWFHHHQTMKIFAAIVVLWKLVGLRMVALFFVKLVGLTGGWLNLFEATKPISDVDPSGWVLAGG